MKDYKPYIEFMVKCSEYDFSEHISHTLVKIKYMNAIDSRAWKKVYDICMYCLNHYICNHYHDDEYKDLIDIIFDMWTYVDNDLVSTGYLNFRMIWFKKYNDLGVRLFNNINYELRHYVKWKDGFDVSFILEAPDFYFMNNRLDRYKWLVSAKAYCTYRYMRHIVKEGRYGWS